VAVAAVAVAVASMLFRRALPSLAGKHVLITGGSSGIGRALAVTCAIRGADVTIVARNKDRLTQAEEEVRRNLINPDKQRVYSVSVDIADSEAVTVAMRSVAEHMGPVYMLVNCAGTAISRRFEEHATEDFRRMMDINYFGGVFVTRALLPQMKAAEEGIIVFVATQAAFMGVYGFSAYSASKFAVRGLAEALDMEVNRMLRRPRLLIALRPPRFVHSESALRSRSRPTRTRRASTRSRRASPKRPSSSRRRQVCSSPKTSQGESMICLGGNQSRGISFSSILNDSLWGHFYSSPGLDGWMLSTLCAGMTRSSVSRLLVQVCLMPVLRVVGFGYRCHFDSIVKECKRKRDQEKRKE
jgi:3-dehydrosphinganine reductase